ncbi:MAG: hypothetical protein AB9866_19705 [Syntrophobacteraceae bacterium]
MERVVVRSGLTGFLLLDSISEINPEAISGSRHFQNAPPWLVMESLAQLGALHVRYLCNFEKHAFLLGVRRCGVSSGKTSGTCLLSGRSLAVSSSAFSYNLLAVGGKDTRIEGEFLFAVVEYDQVHFKEDLLREHYKKVFSCLRSGSNKD